MQKFLFLKKSLTTSLPPARRTQFVYLITIKSLQDTAAHKLVTMAKQEQLSKQETFAGIGLAASVVVLFVGAVLSAQQ